MKVLGKRKSQNEVVARGRLRGALNDLFDETEVSDGHMGSSNIESRRNEERVKQRGRPPKKMREANVSENIAGKVRYHKSVPRKRSSHAPSKEEVTSGSDESDTDNSQPKIPMESRIFKLFDRRVDMSMFSENAPLYPICRAWFRNTGVDPNRLNHRDRQSPPPKRRKYDGPELWDKVRRNEIKEVFELPRPCKTNIPPIPPRLPKNYSQDKATIDAVLKACDKKRVPVDELLQEHKLRWKKVRQEWIKHTIKYRHERFKYSYLILQHLHKRHKEQLMQQLNSCAIIKK